MSAPLQPGARSGAEGDRSSTAETATVVHQGGCHCGAVRFEVDAPADIEALECNCSMCTMTAFVHLIVPAARFRLLAGAAVLETYSFNTGTAKHLFCRRCGVKSFYVPRSNPDGFSINVRCLDVQTVRSVTTRRFDDADRDAAEARIRHLSAG